MLADSVEEIGVLADSVEEIGALTDGVEEIGALTDSTKPRRVNIKAAVIIYLQNSSVSTHANVAASSYDSSRCSLYSIAYVALIVMLDTMGAVLMLVDGHKTLHKESPRGLGPG